jgi:hypothetical protein
MTMYDEIGIIKAQICALKYLIEDKNVVNIISQPYLHGQKRFPHFAE